MYHDIFVVESKTQVPSSAKLTTGASVIILGSTPYADGWRVVAENSGPEPETLQYATTHYLFPFHTTSVSGIGQHALSRVLMPYYLLLRLMDRTLIRALFRRTYLWRTSNFASIYRDELRHGMHLLRIFKYK
ncbi:hypothetical protein ALC53_08352 [Atta colombica]|uniref:Uncharacterized protein n=1 Tax=Atta colombica TaxID=520822 RepID=A0A195B9S5_9HYME|nr:hypothetical protein ALC53_08352 [Atta colombica]